MATILIADDESGVRELLDDALRLAGYATEVAADGHAALDIWRVKPIDLFIIDINMPVMDGFALLKTIRAKDARTPVLLLSARDATADVAQGLRYGADDYVRKPFGLEELLLRVAAILRRTSGVEDSGHRLQCGPLLLDVDRHEVTRDGHHLELSATEFRLLEVLMERKGRLITRDQLLDLVWGIDFDTETSVVDTYISYLRRKVHDGSFAPITTVRGVGFKMMDHPAQ